MSSSNPDPASYQMLLHWLLLLGLMIFVTWLLLDLGVLNTLLAADVTRISSVILLVFVVGCGHCGYRSWILTAEALALTRLQRAWQAAPSLALASEPSLGGQYLQGLGPLQQDNALAAEILAERVRGSHQVGWFMTGVLVKLGLLGTVVGFMLMLGSVSGLENLDTSDLKVLMQQMTTGMGVAMNTTLVGLVCSILLGLQYLLLDRSADRLVADAVTLGQTVLSNDRMSAG
ncbi:MotA/TolQ/ExbB proton channel family protein [Oceanobacter sp. 5_MG-2023]|uniref:MotA/TolQ/ExbB proton channel family protein n=2 Tax=Gammaproteobacteria TaxID=1236 RepID=UPI0026E16F53|nr:MotA/TolQ/ExbB proton channel family protein [Oceanobacter sp. 5_MG-2023]MDO6681851.1 MotA/TolQ/ExbB proton channel family protein [Oceanobacter sp. 5_MG-2023]